MLESIFLNFWKEEYFLQQHIFFLFSSLGAELLIFALFSLNFDASKHVSVFER